MQARHRERCWLRLDTSLKDQGPAVATVGRFTGWNKYSLAAGPLARIRLSGGDLGRLCTKRQLREKRER